MDARKARVIELRFFGGLSVDETAAALKISPQSVMRGWKLARAWLQREMKRESQDKYFECGKIGACRVRFAGHW